jgi:hypothetical protein
MVIISFVIPFFILDDLFFADLKLNLFELLIILISQEHNACISCELMSARIGVYSFTESFQPSISVVLVDMLHGLSRSIPLHSLIDLNHMKVNLFGHFALVVGFDTWKLHSLSIVHSLIQKFLTITSSWRVLHSQSTLLDTR